MFRLQRLSGSIPKRKFGGYRRATAQCTVVSVSLLMSSLSVALGVSGSQPSAAAATPPAAHTASSGLSSAPPALKAAVERELGGSSGQDDRRRMSANYESDGSVALKGSGFNVTVGQFSIGRGTSLTTGPTQLLRTTSGAVYAGSGVAESFALRGLGLEQTFRVARRKGGAGTLTIDLPISGLSASNQHGAIDLRNARGQVVATYSDLRVTDASGAAVSASLVASQGGHSVKIEVRDARASYPLFVDPLWQQVSELSASDGVALDRFGKSVAMFGSTAVIGAPRHYWSNNAEGAVYVFTLSGGSWSQTAELRSSDGATGDQFGTSVAISAGTLVVGAPNKTVSGHSNQGTTYVFTLSGGSWSQTAELTSSDGATGDAFGCSVSVSVPASGSSTILVGATGHAVGGNSGQGSA